MSGAEELRAVELLRRAAADGLIQATEPRLQPEMVQRVVAYGRECAAAALEEAAAAIDRGPTFPMPPSTISALVRERAQDTRAAALKGSEEAET